MNRCTPHLFTPSSYVLPIRRQRRVSVQRIDGGWQQVGRSVAFRTSSR